MASRSSIFPNVMLSDTSWFRRSLRHMNGMKTEISITKPDSQSVTFSLSMAGYLSVVAVLASLVLTVDATPSRFIGGALVSFVLLFVFYRDIMRYKPAYVNNFGMLLLLSLMIIGTLLIGRSFEYVLTGLMKGLGSVDTGIAVYGIPIATGAMLVTLLFDFHTAITFSFT